MDTRGRLMATRPHGDPAVTAHPDPFVPGDEPDQNPPEGDTTGETPDLPDENDPGFVAEVEAGEAEVTDDA